MHSTNTIMINIIKNTHLGTRSSSPKSFPYFGKKERNNIRRLFAPRKKIAWRSKRTLMEENYSEESGRTKQLRKSSKNGVPFQKNQSNFGPSPAKPSANQYQKQQKRWPSPADHASPKSRREKKIPLVSWINWYVDTNKYYY